MKKTIATEIWLVFAISLAIIVLLSILIIPFTLKSFYTDVAFEDIEKSQEFIIEYQSLDKLTAEEFPKLHEEINEFSGIKHFALTEEGYIFPPVNTSLTFIKNVKTEASNQKEYVKRYTKDEKGMHVLYVIRKIQTQGNKSYLISYVGNTYQKSRKDFIFKRISYTLIAIFLLSIIPSIIVAKHIVKPLLKLKKNVNRIANRDWYEPIPIDRDDELGELTKSIEIMRQRLLKQDQAQQSYLQHISHELKTPLMIIQSYVQAIHDGIFPKGNLKSSLDVIEEESKRLEERIQHILFLTKIDYQTTLELTSENIDLEALLQEIITKFKVTRNDLNWNLNLDSLNLEGNKELLTIALENIIKNQLRYAKNNLDITLEQNEDNVLLEISNDGPQIENELLNHLFEKFTKGKDGEFGLGLTIVKHIVTKHKGEVWVTNKKEGVAFFIKLPLKQI